MTEWIQPGKSRTSAPDVCRRGAGFDAVIYAGRPNFEQFAAAAYRQENVTRSGDVIYDRRYSGVRTQYLDTGGPSTSDGEHDDNEHMTEPTYGRRSAATGARTTPPPTRIKRRPVARMYTVYNTRPTGTAPTRSGTGRTIRCAMAISSGWVGRVAVDGSVRFATIPRYREQIRIDDTNRFPKRLVEGISWGTLMIPNFLFDRFPPVFQRSGLNNIG